MPTDPDGRKQAPRYTTQIRQNHGARLTEYLASKTRNGEDLIDRLLEIAEQARSTPDRAREARQATIWLAERIGGRPAQAIHVTGSIGATLGAPLDAAALADIDDAALDALEGAIERALPAGVIDVESTEK